MWMRLIAYQFTDLPAAAAASSAAAARGAAAAEARAAAWRGGGCGDGVAQIGERVAEAAQAACSAGRIGLVIVVGRCLRDGGGAQRGGEAVGPGLLHAERHGVGQEPSELHGRWRRRLHAPEL